jgi:RNA polymerase sigma-70 factor (ECF subfamily)
MQAAQTDPAAFAPVYQAYFERVYAYCRRRVDSTTEAEDLTSIVFIKALRGLRSYRGGNVGAWLFRIAHNELANHWRGQRTVVSLDVVDMDIASSDASPPEVVARREERDTLQHAISLLPAAQRELLALKLDGQLTSEQIGAVVGKSAGAVRVEIHRTLKQLRVLYLQEQDR